jgi:hypothetical protein
MRHANAERHLNGFSINDEGCLLDTCAQSFG